MDVIFGGVGKPRLIAVTDAIFSSARKTGTISNANPACESSVILPRIVDVDASIGSRCFCTTNTSSTVIVDFAVILEVEADVVIPATVSDVRGGLRGGDVLSDVIGEIIGVGSIVRVDAIMRVGGTSTIL